MITVTTTTKPNDYDNANGIYHYYHNDQMLVIEQRTLITIKSVLTKIKIDHKTNNNNNNDNNKKNI